MFTDTDADQVFQTSPLLFSAVHQSLRHTETPKKYSNQAAVCAAYLYSSGWLDDWNNSPEPQLGYVAPSELTEHQTSQAVRHLQAAGLLPSSLLAWVLAFGFRWMISEFLAAFIKTWSSSIANDA